MKREYKGCANHDEGFTMTLCQSGGIIDGLSSRHYEQLELMWASPRDPDHKHPIITALCLAQRQRRHTDATRPPLIFFCCTYSQHCWSPFLHRSHSTTLNGPSIVNLHPRSTFLQPCSFDKSSVPSYFLSLSKSFSACSTRARRQVSINQTHSTLPSLI